MMSDENLKIHKIECSDLNETRFNENRTNHQKRPSSVLTKSDNGIEHESVGEWMQRKDVLIIISYLLIERNEL